MNYRTKRTLAAVAATALAVSAAQATTYYAAPAGAADADCLTPQTAGTLDLAVSKATADGDIIQLASGDYDRSASPVTLSVAGITLKGASDDPTQTVLVGPGTAKSMTGVVVTKKAVVCDLTISNFYQSTKGGAAAAGANGATTLASSLTARNCRIVCNTTANGRYVRGATVYGGTWNNCVFSGNKSNSSNGGAADSGTFIDCIFTNNTAAYYAGALYNGTAIGCLFIDNKTTASGCGFGAVYGGTSRGCTFIRNTSYFGGAGGANSTDKSYFYDCFFTNNTATSTGHGGALYGAGNSNVTASNCVFIGNSSTKAEGQGGAALRAIEIQADVILLAKNVDAVYDSDPAKNPNAKRYTKITHSEVLEKDLKVMDSTAASLCRDNGMKIHVFGLAEPNGIIRACAGEEIGTIVY